MCEVLVMRGRITSDILMTKGLCCDTAPLPKRNGVKSVGIFGREFVMTTRGRSNELISARFFFIWNIGNTYNVHKRKKESGIRVFSFIRFPL